MYPQKHTIRTDRVSAKIFETQAKHGSGDLLSCKLLTPFLRVSEDCGALPRRSFGRSWVGFHDGYWCTWGVDGSDGVGSLTIAGIGHIAWGSLSPA
eukprot:4923803-Amphidinium_carterae.2